MDRNSNARSWFLHMQRFSIRSPVVFSLLILRQKTQNRNVDYIDMWTLISGYSELPGYTAIAWSSAIPQNPQEFIRIRCFWTDKNTGRQTHRSIRFSSISIRNRLSTLTHTLEVPIPKTWIKTRGHANHLAAVQISIVITLQQSRASENRAMTGRQRTEAAGMRRLPTCPESTPSFDLTNSMPH